MSIRWTFDLFMSNSVMQFMWRRPAANTENCICVLCIFCVRGMSLQRYAAHVIVTESLTIFGDERTFPVPHFHLRSKMARKTEHQRQCLDLLPVVSCLALVLSGSHSLCYWRANVMKLWGHSLRIRSAVSGPSSGQLIFSNYTVV